MSWLKEQFAETERQIKKWPAWMKREVGIVDNEAKNGVQNKTKQDGMNQYKNLPYRERELLDYFRKLPENSKNHLLDFLKIIVTS